MLCVCFFKTIPDHYSRFIVVQDTVETATQMSTTEQESSSNDQDGADRQRGVSEVIIH